MVVLAMTRNGVADFLGRAPSDVSLWLGGAVLSQAEIDQLRQGGTNLTVLNFSIRTEADFRRAMELIEEHHPSETVSAEVIPASENPQSAHIGAAFLWREFIVGVHFSHNDYVEVITGPLKGEGGSLVSLVALEPEPTFVLESESGRDVYVGQSQIVARAAT